MDVWQFISEGGFILAKNLKGSFTEKLKFWFTRPRVAPNLYEFLSSVEMSELMFFFLLLLWLKASLFVPKGRLKAL